MAEGKNKIIVYKDWLSTFESLTDEEAGRLIKHFFFYVNDMNPQGDRLTELLFNPIKQTLKRDLKAWEIKQGINRENGQKGGRPKKTQNNPNNPVGFLETQNNPEKGVSDSVSVNDINKDTNVSSNSSVDGIDYKLLLKFINETFGREFRVVNKAVKSKYNARLKEGWKKSDIQKAILSVRNDPFHIENDFKYVTLDYFSRDKTLQIHATGKFIPKTKSFDPWS